MKDRIENKCSQDTFFLILGPVLIVIFYTAHAFFVLPVLYELHEYAAHLLFGTYLLHGVLGNLVRGSLGGPGTVSELGYISASQEWRSCAPCSRLAPPRSWHCDLCNVCVLKRDHHCNFFGCCVGHRNHRYFCCFVLTLFFSMIYTLYLNVRYLVLILSARNYTLVNYIRFLFPFVAAATDMSEESFFVCLLLINVIILGFTGFLIYHHAPLVLRGEVTPEKKRKDSKLNYNMGWRNNLIQVFGKRWYLAILSPLAPSNLPSDGTEWPSRVRLN